MASEFLSVTEAAEMLKVSEITVKRYIYAGKLRSSKLPGGRHRIPLAEVEQLLQGGDATLPTAEEVTEGLGQRVEELEGALEQMAAELQVLAAWCARRQQTMPLAEEAAPLARIEVLGPGCRRCKKLYDLVSEIVARELAGRCTVERVTDLDRITDYGPVLTPTLVVEGRVVSTGRVPDKKELTTLLPEALGG